MQKAETSRPGVRLQEVASLHIVGKGSKKGHLQTWADTTLTGGGNTTTGAAPRGKIL